MDPYSIGLILETFLADLKSDDALSKYFEVMNSYDKSYLNMMNHAINMLLTYDLETIPNSKKRHIQAVHYKLKIDKLMFEKWICCLKKTFTKCLVHPNVINKLITNIHMTKCFIIYDEIHTDIRDEIELLNAIVK